MLFRRLPPRRPGRYDGQRLTAVEEEDMRTRIHRLWLLPIVSLLLALSGCLADAQRSVPGEGEGEGEGVEGEGAEGEGAEGEGEGAEGEGEGAEPLPEVAPGEIAIVEVYGKTLDGERQWLELANVAGAPRELAGCLLAYSRVDDPGYAEVRRALSFGDSSSLLAPGQRLILAKTSCALFAGHLCATYPAIVLTASLTDSLALFCPRADGSVPLIDRISYNLRSQEVAAGQSLSFPQAAADAAVANDRTELWCATAPTPGAPNSCR